MPYLLLFRLLPLAFEGTGHPVCSDERVRSNLEVPVVCEGKFWFPIPITLVPEHERPDRRAELSAASVCSKWLSSMFCRSRFAHAGGALPPVLHPAHDPIQGRFGSKSWWIFCNHAGRSGHDITVYSQSGHIGASRRLWQTLWSWRFFHTQEGVPQLSN